METQKKSRLQSIDALRGFDMFWIMGGPAIIASLYAITGSSFWEQINEQMEHVPWHGFHFMDLIFPLFLFIAGVSFPFSLAKRRTGNETDQRIRQHVFKRAILLFIFGLIYNGLFRFDQIRYASVLARIGFAWMFGALIYMHTRKTQARVLWALGLLVFYGLLISLVPAPDAPVGIGIFSPERSIVAWFDRMFLPGVLYGGNFDPEGYLGLIPATSTALFGMLSGSLLASKGTISPVRKALYLFVAGIVLLIATILLNLVLPINKALWSPSFVLITGGISLLLLSLFYWVIDVKGYRNWSFPFQVIGLNSITIYLAQQIIDFWGISNFFFGGIASMFSKDTGSLILSCGYVLVCWLFLWFLYQKKIFLKV